MEDSGYKSGTNGDVPDTSRLCRRLAAMSVRLEQQQAELLRPQPVYQGFSSAIHSMQSTDESKTSIPALAAESLIPIGTNRVGTRRKVTAEKRDLSKKESAVNSWTAPATIFATVGPQLSILAAPVTPENQIWHNVEEEAEEQNDAMRVVRAALGRKDSLTPESEVDPQDEIGPFDTIPGFTSESVKNRARRVAHKARVSQKFVDSIDNTEKCRASNTKSPTPATIVRAPDEWRNSRCARQAKLMQTSPESIRPTQILAHRSASLSPEPTPFIHSSTRDTKPRRFLAEPVLEPTELSAPCAEIDTFRANHFKGFLAEPVLASTQPQVPNMGINRLDAIVQDAVLVPRPDVAEIEEQASQQFSHRRKKSRSSKLFESMKARDH